MTTPGNYLGLFLAFFSIISITALNPICSEPPVTGRCRAMQRRFFWSPELKECVEFVYGGCGGNQNRFEEEEDCQLTCGNSGNAKRSSKSKNSKTKIEPDLTFDSVCLEPKDVGSCRAKKTRFYFDNDSKSCQTFVYGGCGGNGNRFDSEQACETMCEADREDSKAEIAVPTTPKPLNVDIGAGIDLVFTDDSPGPDVTMDSRCLEPKLPGKCKARKYRFFWNPETKSCETFVYGGCGGNGNRFDTLDDCNSLCQKGHQPSQSELAPDQTKPGDNKDQVDRKKPIDPKCHQVKTLGSCRGRKIQYFYEVLNGTCSQFIYGGCQGNDNRFDTFKDCATACMPWLKSNESPSPLPELEKPLETSTLPPTAPPTLTPAAPVKLERAAKCLEPKDTTKKCLKKVFKFYWDTKTNSCQAYSATAGCGTSRNTFSTKKTCQDTCSEEKPVGRTHDDIESDSIERFRSKSRSMSRSDSDEERVKDKRRRRKFQKINYHIYL